MVLTRNNFVHGNDLWDDGVYQDERHAKKYPDSAFKHNWMPKMFRGQRLVITKEKLEATITEVVKLCAFLEDTRGGRQYKVQP